MTHHPWSLPDLRPGIPADADLLARRESLRALDALQIVAPEAIVSEQIIGGISCIVVEAGVVRTTMLYAHGGGFRLGEPRTWIGFASRLAVAAGLRIVLPDYRLAPEHPFPAALYDLVGVYRTLGRDPGPAPLLGGDSAGGGLACSLALIARDAGTPASAVVLLSPWLDLMVEAASYAECAISDQAFSEEAAKQAADQYLMGVDASTPLASPLRQHSLASFPPLWMTVSSSEVLRDDAINFAYRIVREGGMVELSACPSLPHVWPLLMPQAAETEKTIASIARFVSR